MSDVVYLYGFVPHGAPAPPPELHGVGGAPVELIPAGGISAVIARLPRADFGKERVEAQLDDLAWVGEQGMAHERVVLWFADHADILPARLLSLYSGDAALRAAVAPRTDALRQRLEALRGLREWNLKVAYDATALAAHADAVSGEVRALDAEITAAAPGRRYLLERKRTDILKREVARGARRLADELLDALAAHARNVRRLPVPAEDAGGTVVLHAALLVDRASAQPLRAEAERRHQQYTDLGLIVSFSGPWAPYRFVEDEHDA